MRPGSPVGRSSGFSLLELLAATGLTALLGGAIVAALLAGVRVWERTATFEAVRIDTALALETLARDFRNRLALSQGPFDGEARSCAFTTLADGEGEEGAPALILVTYRFGAGALTRTVNRLPSSGSGRTEVIVAGLSGFRFAYLARPVPQAEDTAFIPAAAPWTWRGDAAEPGYEVGGLRLSAVGGRSHEPFELSMSVLRP